MVRYQQFIPLAIILLETPLVGISQDRPNLTDVGVSILNIEDL